MVSEEESAALDVLLDANGYTRDNLPAVDQIPHLEMFLHFYPKVRQHALDGGCSRGFPCVCMDDVAAAGTAGAGGAHGLPARMTTC